MATGMALSASTKSGVPFWVSAGICAVFIGGYEYMIAHPAKKETSTVPINVINTSDHWGRR